MKKSSLLGAISLLTALQFGPANAAQVCLSTHLIDRTKVVDTKTIDFYMRNRSVYRSIMRQPCYGLSFNGFAYVTPIDDICGNLQTIRVLQSGEVCLLGPFKKLEPKAATTPS